MDSLKAGDTFTVDDPELLAQLFGCDVKEFEKGNRLYTFKVTADVTADEVPPQD